MNCTTEEIMHEAQGEEFIKNPDYVAATEGYYETVVNPDYLPAHTKLVGYEKWKWTKQGKHGSPDGPPPGSGWKSSGITNDSKAEYAFDVIHQGNGNGSYFYFGSVYEEVPAVGTPTKEVWVEGTPAIGEEFIKNPEYVPAWTEQVETCTPPIVTCPEGKVPGWLDEFGNAQGCVDNNPMPPEVSEDVEVLPETPVVVPEDSTVEMVEVVGESAFVDEPELAVTGGADGVSAVLFGAVLFISGLAFMMKRKEA